nr:prepilin-type N-terminal cleavage/methylation domain-containing protein [uncultured Tolumonas sp.]
MVKNSFSQLRYSGFSLIELMVVLAVMSILATLGTALTQSWSSSNQLQLGKNLLTQGAAHAKSLALRNGSGTNSNTVAAFLVLKNNMLCVLNGTATTLDCSSPVWQTQLKVSASINSASTQCIGWNSMGLQRPLR